VAKQPTGTVTFLFTDIEGSTRLWEQHPEAMRGALAHHDALLRQAIERHSGYVFKTVGDSSCAAFATAAGALAAAVAVHRALLGQVWAETGPLRVRMALHTGPAEERGGDYFGSPLHQVARLLAAGHGGQTLLSQAVSEKVAHALPEGASLRDLGEHRLRDLLHPMRIFQLLTPDLPADFPPLATLERPDTARRLRVISLEMLSLLDRGAILSLLMSELPTVFPAKSAALFLLDPAGGVYRQTNPQKEALTLSPKESLLLHRLKESGRPVGTDAAHGASANAVLASSDWDLARRLGVVLWVPLMLWGRLIGVLALGHKTSQEVYTEEELDALCLISNEAAVALENATLSAERERQARLQQELAIARSIQLSMLPPASLRVEGYEFVSRSELSTEVGGDFCSLFELGHRDRAAGLASVAPAARLGVLVGDVAGKGVPAALFMTVTTTLIQAQAQLLLSPTETLAAANAELYPKMRPSGGQRLFATAIYGVLDLVQGKMRLANAGQPPPIYWPVAGTPHYLPVKGVPLGALRGSCYEEATIRLGPGDRLLLCTDGFIEESTAEGKVVGYDGFLARLSG
jgi:serine phosphatase RsbU (regulator of sigma subunit)/class 3 adenylate cyclase